MNDLTHPAKSGTPRVPILVTGVPRSGTTWLARQLACSPEVAMTGREPMNPHRGQYALGGSIDAWARLDPPTHRQLRSLRRAYRGHTPRVYGKYGSRQWAAPLPTTKIVVKDPFAMLAVSVVHQATNALPIVLYRHPGAILASYRRMGWEPDIAELIRALPEAQTQDVPLEDATSRLAWFWATLNSTALTDLADIPGALVISHEELASGGQAAMRQVYQACNLHWSPKVEQALVAQGTTRNPKVTVNAAGKTLHRLDRASESVASSWRAKVTKAELELLEKYAGPTLDALTERRLILD